LVYGAGPGKDPHPVRAYILLRGEGSTIDEIIGEKASPVAAQEPVGVSIIVAEEKLREGSPEDFLQSLRVLYPMQKPVDALYSALRHSDPTVRVNALSMLSEMGSGNRAKLALKAAANDSDPMVSGLARRMLGLEN